MSQSAVETVAKEVEVANGKAIPERAGKAEDTRKIEKQSELETSHKEPLKPSGALNQFEFFDVTPIIGREFVNVDLAEWLQAPNSDDLLRELAITVSRRGVVFFRKQDNINNELQKKLVQKLGELSGKPETSRLHIHPIANSERDTGGQDNEISIISSALVQGLSAGDQSRKPQTRKREWHSDIGFEPNPSDYALLRLTKLPETGGDTLWGSGYELYDRISKPLRGFLETLTGNYSAKRFNEAAEKFGFTIYTAPRGSPANAGTALEATHPIVRTNPVTGWKSIYAIGTYAQKINGLSDEESRHFLEWFLQLIVENHDLQVRHRWQNVNDIAIWDNRSVYHAATPDYEGLGERSGSRAVSVGERPYFDPQSVSRREGLLKEQELSVKMI